MTLQATILDGTNYQEDLLIKCSKSFNCTNITHYYFFVRLFP